LKDDSSSAYEIQPLKLDSKQGATEDVISVNMGEPRLQWAEVPVKEEVDTLHCKDKVEAEGLTDCAGAFRKISI
jgi:hypothetical protein